MLSTQSGRPIVGVSEKTYSTLGIIKTYIPLLQLLDVEDIEAAIEELNKTRTIQPIFDPTGFMNTGAAVETWMEFLYRLEKLVEFTPKLIEEAGRV